MDANIKTAVIIAVTLAIIILIAVLTLTVLIKLQSAARRKKIEGFGKQSEERTDALLKKAFGSEAVFSGVFLPYLGSSEGKHAEIDHLVITRNGICVIEVKSHNGQIRCPDERYWWQTYNEKKISFYNPLWQNKTHSKIVGEIMRSEGQYDIPIYSVVVFTSRRVTFSHQHKYVIKIDGLVDFIRKNGRKNSLSQSRVKRIRDIIARKASQSRSVQKSHKADMRKASRNRSKRYYK